METAACRPCRVRMKEGRVIRAVTGIGASRKGIDGVEKTPTGWVGAGTWTDRVARHLARWKPKIWGGRVRRESCCFVSILSGASSATEPRAMQGYLAVPLFVERLCTGAYSYAVGVDHESEGKHRECRNEGKIRRAENGTPSPATTPPCWIQANKICTCGLAVQYRYLHSAQRARSTCPSMCVCTKARLPPQIAYA